MTGLLGLDVSHHNGPVSWSKVRAAGYRFAYLKATEGTSYVDPTFTDHRARARAAGVFVGAYHFARPSGSAVDQARHFAEVLGRLDKGHLPPALDIEDSAALSPEQLAAWCNAFLTELRHCRPERTPLLYTYASFHAHQLAGGRALASWPLWFARYASKLDSADPKPLIWQHTSTGRVDGITGNVDLNYFLGTDAQLDQLAGWPPEQATHTSHPIPPRPRPSTSPDRELTVKPINLRHAHEHLVTGPGVRSLQALLILAGELHGPVDGRAGLGTRTALCNFQSKHGLTVDAIAGVDTFDKLVSL